jgi:hypothetical protein
MGKPEEDECLRILRCDALLTGSLIFISKITCAASRVPSPYHRHPVNDRFLPLPDNCFALRPVRRIAVAVVGSRVAALANERITTRKISKPNGAFSALGFPRPSSSPRLFQNAAVTPARRRKILAQWSRQFHVPVSASP